jgi:hypothetical protein
VYAKVPGLLDPIFDERVAQGMFGFGFRQVCALNDEAVFESFVRLHGVEAKARAAFVNCSSQFVGAFEGVI